MIKPYIKSDSNAKIVEVEDFGVIDLSKLPIRVREDERGIYEILWVSPLFGDVEKYTLSECGGTCGLDYGGRDLGVIREIK